MLEVFDLAIDSGFNQVSNSGLDSVDTLRFEGFASNYILKFDPLTISSVDYLDIIIEDDMSNELLRVRINRPDFETGEGFEMLQIDDNTLYMQDLFTWIDNDSIDDTYSFSNADLMEEVYPFNSDDSAVGVTPVVEGSTITEMNVSPYYYGSFANNDIATETFHPWVITYFNSYSTGPGYHTEAHFDTFIKSFKFVPGISADDIRLTVSSDIGTADLTIHIESLGQSFTVPYFEEGKHIEGIGLYGTGLHTQIQAGGGYMNVGSNGQFTGYYDSASIMTYGSSTVDVTYFLETLKFANGSSINLTGTLTLEGTASGETVYGLDTRNDVIYGYDGEDNLQGRGGNDLLIGGNGADDLYGGEGNDTYYFASNFADWDNNNDYDRIVESLSAGTDTIEFADLASTDVYTWATYEGNLYIQEKLSPSNTVFISGNFNAGGIDIPDRIESIVFTDTTWDLTQGLILNDSHDGHTIFGSTLSDIIRGNGGDDEIRAHDGNDTLIGGIGADTLRGGAGNDTYYFESGFANWDGSDDYDWVDESASSGADTIEFGDLASSEVYLWSDYTGSMYIQSIYDTEDTIRVQGNYSSGGIDIPDRIETIVFTDTTWDLTQGLILNDSDVAHTGFYGSHLNDTINGNGGNDQIRGWDGNDTINGGTGADTLLGNDGDDTYVFETGFADWNGSSGHDAIQENIDEGFDTIQFGSGLTADDFYTWTDSNGYMYIQSMVDANDRIRIWGDFTSGVGVDISERIEEIVFSDSSSWDLTQGLIINDTDDSRSNIYGSAANDLMKGNGGNDILRGWVGNDTLIGGTGNDSLYGDAGDDLYIFNTDFSASTSGDSVREDVSGASGTDTVLLTDGFTADDFYFWTDSSGDLWLQGKTDAATNTLFITGSYSSSTGVDVGSYVERITFDNETVIDLTQGLWLYDTDSNRVLYGSALADEIYANGGNDTIRAFGGNDVIHGGAGNDDMFGGAGDDLYVLEADFSGTTAGDNINESSYGGAGTDTVWFTDGATADDFYYWTDSGGDLWIQGKTDAATNTLEIDGTYSATTGVDVGSFVEYITFDNMTTIDLTQGLHLVNNNTARTLYGSAQNDIIEGGTANDTLRGFAGDDILIGHNGTDALWGYEGSDTFTFLAANVGNGVDTIRDFDIVTDDDIIDISDILSGYDPMVDALADFVQFTNAGSNSNLSVDMDGAGTTYGWTQIATVYDHNGLDAATLATAGNLLVA